MDGINSNHIAFRKEYASIAGSCAGGIFLAQVYYWTKNETSVSRDGWFYKSQHEWMEETGLTRREQENARRRLVASGCLEEKREGLPCRLWYRLNLDRLQALLNDTSHLAHQSVTSSNLVSTHSDTLEGTHGSTLVGTTCDTPDCGNVADILNETEITTKTTTEITAQTTHNAPAHTHAYAHVREPGLQDEYDGWFSEWWAEYPRRGRKNRSLVKMMILEKVKSCDRESIMLAAIHYASSSTALRGMVMNAENFVDDGNWEIYVDGPITEPTVELRPLTPIQDGRLFARDLAEQGRRMLNLIDQARETGGHKPDGDRKYRQYDQPSRLDEVFQRGVSAPPSYSGGRNGTLFSLPDP